METFSIYASKARVYSAPSFEKAISCAQRLRSQGYTTVYICNF